MRCSYVPTLVRCRGSPLVLLGVLAGCATDQRDVDRLPFHIAIAPPEVRDDLVGTASRRGGSVASITYVVDEAAAR
jgi:hypothetical protein